MKILKNIKINLVVQFFIFLFVIYLEYFYFRNLLIGFFILLVGYGRLVFGVRQISKKIEKTGGAGLKIEGWKPIFRDELTDLVDSYNSLADRSEYLIAQIAEKIGVEKEVQTAEIVQSLFFPSDPFIHSQINLYGKVLTASQCAGDWWNYCKIGNYLVMGVGDATGHGVSAALMMAAVHGAYSISMRQCERNSDDAPSLNTILSQINESCYSVAGGENTMTFISSVIDLRTGKLTLVNASHPPPYLLRMKHGDGDEEILKIVKPIIAPCASPLGSQIHFSAQPVQVQLEPGDILFWYTDGFIAFGKSRRDGSPDRLSILKGLRSNAQDHFPDPVAICDSALLLCAKNRDQVPEHLTDDMTLVVATIPFDAQFEP